MNGIVTVASLFIASLYACAQAYNLNIIGHIQTCSSFSRHTTSFVDCLKDTLPINVYLTRASSARGFANYFAPFIKNGFDLKTMALKRQVESLTGVTIYADSVLWTEWKQYKKLHNKSMLTFAYCVAERELDPTLNAPVLKKWVHRLNSNFDALLVPDPWLVNNFKNAGITIPIFVLPLVLDLHSLLKTPQKTGPNKPFTFGFSGGCWPHKNVQLLIRAFSDVFGNNPDVMLKLHSRFNKSPYARDVQRLLDQLKMTNIVFEQQALSRHEFEKFLTSLDCYVSLAKGEGFSIIPREAMAAGIPCIISDTTAHITICNTGFVRTVPTPVKNLSFWAMSKHPVGYDFSCTLEEAKQALVDVYTHYAHYLALAQTGRTWPQAFLPETLQEQYAALVKPRECLLGTEDRITQTGVITTSKKLYKKYKTLLQENV